MTENSANEIAGYKKLLAIATQAQGEQPANTRLPPLDSQNRKWLENSLKVMSSDADPVKHLKSQLTKLSQFERRISSSPAGQSEEMKSRFVELSEEIMDLVCDIDLALIFCHLGGLAILNSIADLGQDFYSSTCMSLISELAQNNPSVQELVLKEPFLDKCLRALDGESTSEEMRIKCLGAISATVKGYLPALEMFVRSDGLETIKRCLQSAMEKDETRTARRVAITTANIYSSFEPQVSKETNINELLDYIRLNFTSALEEGTRPEQSKAVYKELIAYIDP